jgi:hypothetical protein
LAEPLTAVTSAGEDVDPFIIRHELKARDPRVPPINYRVLIKCRRMVTSTSAPEEIVQVSHPQFCRYHLTRTR